MEIVQTIVLRLCLHMITLGFLIIILCNIAFLQAFPYTDVLRLV